MKTNSNFDIAYGYGKVIKKTGGVSSMLLEVAYTILRPYRDALEHGGRNACKRM